VKISIATTIPKEKTLILFALENETFGIQDKKLIEEAKEQGFKGKENTTVLLFPKNESPAKRIILTGLGKEKTLTEEKLRRASACALRKAQNISSEEISLFLPQILNNPYKESYAILEGALLANYKFDKYLSKQDGSKKIQSCSVIGSEKFESDIKKGIELAQTLSETACFVRDLVNEPPSSMTPTQFAKLAKEVEKNCKSSGIRLKIFEKKEIEKMGMGALLGVNRGSAEPPIFLHFHYKPVKASKSIAFVGKGITFDSGGLSLKTAEGMETMKMDMAGAATILGIFKAIPKIKPAVELHGIMALTENMPGGRAYKPGDVLKAMNGKTIEVLNTDAEGRLILADALSYAVKQNPDAIIDLATLTMAVVIGLGALVAGYMGNNEELLNAIKKASLESNEKFWPLPLEKDYREGLNSTVADIKNISSTRREGGSIVGGLFLQEFVGDKPWAHLDIAGPAWSAKESHYLSPGGTGFPSRTLLHYLLSFN